MADERILIVRLTALGDILHALPAAAALRGAFPRARLDWVVDRKWAEILEKSPALDNVIPFDRSSWPAMSSTIRRLRAARYSLAVDFQGLYKSAVLAWLSGAPRRAGFARSVAREGGAALFYNLHAAPSGGHVSEQNLAIAALVGAPHAPARFPLHIPADADAAVARELERNHLRRFYTLCPGGSWRAKLWPAERYGELHRELEHSLGLRGVVLCGPGERELADAVVRAAAPSQPVVLATSLQELKAVVARASFLVGADSGPLHLAVALGTPVVGLYGPTDPARNGPFCAEDVVVRKAGPEETSYKRLQEYSPLLLRITVEDVVRAVEERISRLRASRGAAP